MIKIKKGVLFRFKWGNDPVSSNYNINGVWYGGSDIFLALEDDYEFRHEMYESLCFGAKCIDKDGNIMRFSVCTDYRKWIELC